MFRTAGTTGAEEFSSEHKKSRLRRLARTLPAYLARTCKLLREGGVNIPSVGVLFSLSLSLYIQLYLHPIYSSGVFCLELYAAREESPLFLRQMRREAC